MDKYIDDIKGFGGFRRRKRELAPQPYLEHVNEFNFQQSNYVAENPILALASQLPNVDPWLMTFTNTSNSPINFELFNADVNYNTVGGGFVIPQDIGKSNDYQTWVGDGWTGSDPPTSLYFENRGHGVPPTNNGLVSWKEMLYEVMVNPITISNVFFKTPSGMANLLEIPLVIREYDSNGNFRKDTKRLITSPYTNTSNASVDSPITTIVDGKTQIYLEAVPSGMTIEAYIYPNKNIDVSDNLSSGVEEIMM